MDTNERQQKLEAAKQKVWTHDKLNEIRSSCEQDSNDVSRFIPVGCR